FGEPSITENEGVKKADQYIHPDIHFSYPVIPKKSGDKPVSTDYISEWRNFLQQTPYGNVFDWLQSIGAENKQGNITAAECSDILRKLQLKSFESAHKILLMWMPEYLGNEGNKLLKLIEEPPANTLFILVAEKEENILPTILSRCQIIRIPAIENTEIAKALTERCRIDQEQAIQLSGMCNGNYREALQLLQHGENDWQVVLRDWLNTLLKADNIGQIKWAEEMSQYGREKQKQFLQYFIHLIESSLRVQFIESGSLEISEKEKDFAGRLNKLCSVGQLEAISAELDKATYYIERNANAKMLFAALSIKLFHIIKHQAVPVVS
ncbi:MAG: ATP-binding protein, partial [Bacteroidota bacterium]